MFVRHIVKTQGPIERSELIETTGLPRTTVADAVATLEERGELTKQQSERDKRRVRYDIRK
nr:helix-turn-helix domain-containing protein [Halalkalicoccus sp. NIPERK01]